MYGYIYKTTCLINNKRLTKDAKDHLVDNSLVTEYLQAGYTFGRTYERKAWNKGKTKVSNEALQNISDIRKQKIAAGEIRCCYDLKGCESPNYIQDEELLARIQKDDFEQYLFEHGKCRTISKFKMNYTTFDRSLKLLNIVAKKVGHAYSFSKAKS